MRPHPPGPHGLSTPGALEYAVRATAALAPFSRAATDRIVAEELLPRLLG